MATLETHTPVQLSPLQAEALRIRQSAAMRIIGEMGSVEDRLDLLAAVVWPSDPLLGLPSTTPSATG